MSLTAASHVQGVRSEDVAAPGADQGACVLEWSVHSIDTDCMCVCVPCLAVGA